MDDGYLLVLFFYFKIPSLSSSLASLEALLFVFVLHAASDTLVDTFVIKTFSYSLFHFWL